MHECQQQTCLLSAVPYLLSLYCCHCVICRKCWDSNDLQIFNEPHVSLLFLMQSYTLLTVVKRWCRWPTDLPVVHV